MSLPGCPGPSALAQDPFVAGFTPGFEAYHCLQNTHRDMHGTCIYAPSVPCFHRPRLVCQSVSLRGLGGAVRLPHNFAVSCIRPVTQLNISAWADSLRSAPSPSQGSPRADVAMMQLRPTESWAVLCGSRPFLLFSRFHESLPVGHKLINYVLFVSYFK